MSVFRVSHEASSNGPKRLRSGSSKSGASVSARPTVARIFPPARNWSGPPETRTGSKDAAAHWRSHFWIASATTGRETTITDISAVVRLTWNISDLPGSSIQPLARLKRRLSSSSTMASARATGPAFTEKVGNGGGPSGDALTSVWKSCKSVRLGCSSESAGFP